VHVSNNKCISSGSVGRLCGGEIAVALVTKAHTSGARELGRLQFLFPPARPVYVLPRVFVYLSDLVPPLCVLGSTSSLLSLSVLHSFGL
jgi:hypothetical protein